MLHNQFLRASKRRRKILEMMLPQELAQSNLLFNVTCRPFCAIALKDACIRVTSNFGDERHLIGVELPNRQRLDIKMLQYRLWYHASH